MCSKEEKPPFVLFADDNEDILEMLAVAARVRGWTFHEARSAEELLRLINASCADGAECYDAVVSDIRFVNPRATEPMLDGVSALRQVRKRLPDLPFIFLTAYAGPLIRNEVKALGGEVEDKPTEVGRLLDRVEATIEVSKPRGGYAGPDRRYKSINRSGQFRRKTDHVEITVPRVLEEAHAAAGRRAR